MYRNLFSALLTATYLFGSADAHALSACPANALPPSVYVGDTTRNKNCKYDKIQEAIDNIPCQGAYVVINNTHSYTAQKLNIQDKSLTLIGSTAACGTSSLPIQAQVDAIATLTQPVITISGAGQTSASVINITGNSNVTLQYLDITGAHVDSDSSGGGISFTGQGSLTLDTSVVDHNYAGYGGGIYFSPGDGNATLTLKQHAHILNNTAQYSGGGIRLGGSGDATLLMLEDDTTVSFNKALGINPANNQPKYGYGGGIELTGFAVADIGSPGAILVGAVTNNSATYGGGIAIVAAEFGYDFVRLFTTDANRPVTISRNTATAKGGGIYIDRQIDEDAWLCAYDYRIIDNSAPDGAAIYSDIQANPSDTYPTPDLLRIALNPHTACLSPPVAARGAVRCAAGVACNEVSGNGGVKDGVASGSIISLNKMDYAEINNLVMQGNTAEKMISAIDNDMDGNFDVDTCLITDNHSTHEVIHTENQFAGDDMGFTQCTFANNIVDDGYLIYAKEVFHITNSILDQPGIPAIDHPNDCTPFSCATVHNILSTPDKPAMPNDGSVGYGDPAFVDSDNADPSKRDYHLTAFMNSTGPFGSAAINYAPHAGGVDLDGNPRDQVAPPIGFAGKSRDLGAYEAQPVTDRIFAHGFGDLISILK